MNGRLAAAGWGYFAAESGVGKLTIPAVGVRPIFWR